MLEADTTKPEGAERPNSGNQSHAPTISLPKGGGAIRGIGENFAANPVTGSGSMSIPLPTMCSADEFSDIEAWAKERIDWLRGFLVLEHGIPALRRPVGFPQYASLSFGVRWKRCAFDFPRQRR